jgi:hypothetical protein
MCGLYNKGIVGINWVNLLQPERSEDMREQNQHVKKALMKGGQQ